MLEEEEESPHLLVQQISTRDPQGWAYMPSEGWIMRSHEPNYGSRRKILHRGEKWTLQVFLLCWKAKKGEKKLEACPYTAAKCSKCPVGLKCCAQLPNRPNICPQSNSGMAVVSFLVLLKRALQRWIERELWALCTELDCYGCASPLESNQRSLR